MQKLGQTSKWPRFHTKPTQCLGIVLFFCHIWDLFVTASSVVNNDHFDWITVNDEPSGAKRDVISCKVDHYDYYQYDHYVIIIIMS